MKTIRIEPYESGGHDNFLQSTSVPEGWAVVPEELETPNFPFGDIEAEEIDGVMTVTKWTPRDIPKAEETEQPITEMEQLRADVDYIAVMTGVEL